MKINHPVTDREVMMKPGTILVTHTNLKGIITYTNDDFVEISGFTRDELIGANHNIVRHPDMPPEAFQDLWDTLKAGKPWVNLVKNRCKSGDYYWVEANVTPIVEKGQIVGYLSVRYSPSREQIRQAEALYENVKNKKAKIREVTLFDKVNFVKNFNLSKKITFIAILLLIPTFLLLGLFNHEKNINIEFAEKEISGIDYLNKLHNLSVNLINYRRSFDGVGYSTENPSAFDKPISESINELDDLFAKSGFFSSTENNAWGSVKAAWSDLKSSNDDNERRFMRVSEIIEDLNATVVQVADASNLSLDPDVDSYYLMTVSTTALPELLDRVGRLQSSGLKALKNGRELDDKAKIDLAVYTQSSKKRAELVKNNLTIAFNNNPALKASLLSQHNDYEQNISNFFNTFSQDIYHPENIPSSPQQILDKGISLNQSISRFSTSVNNELKNLLQKRIDNFKQDRLIKLVSVIALLLIVLVIGYYIVRYIIASINNVNTVLYKLGEGDFKNKIDLDGEDELAVLRRYLQSTQVKLNADVSNAREQAIKATRIMQALDNVQSCVMMADNNMDIIFMNKSILEMFRNAQEDIRTDLPNFDINKLLGANIDQFHKNPAHQRGLLSNLKTTFSSNLVVGGRHLRIVANPVTNEAGEKLGVVVEWTDRTREVKVEQEIEEIVDSVKIGRLDKRLSLADKQGFFAKLSEGINELTDVIERVFKDIGSTMESMSEGDLTNRITSEYQGVYLNCKNDINATIDKLSEIFSQVNESANFINNSSQEIASGNNNLSQRAEQQAANLEQTAASMEELTSTVKNNADNAQQANLVASNARELAEKGGKVVNAAVAAMQEINESSNKIADIISVIDEIAFQTNLLALNASVEAARAGEQGRGFSVVATEVRNLAQRSATAARESKELIQSSVQKVRAGSEFVNQTGVALNEIVAGVKKVGDIVAGIADASVEQSAGIAQVNQAVSQMDEITQQNAALAEEASAASVSMSDLSTNMVELLSFFKLENTNKNQPKESKHSQSRSATNSASTPKSSSPSAVTRQAVYKSTASEEEWQDF